MLFAASVLGLPTGELYREWVTSGGWPKCGSTTTLGRLCENSIYPKGYRVKGPAEWLAAHRSECRHCIGGPISQDGTFYFSANAISGNLNEDWGKDEIYAVVSIGGLAPLQSTILTTSVATTERSRSGPIGLYGTPMSGKAYRSSARPRPSAEGIDLSVSTMADHVGAGTAALLLS